MGRIKLNKLKMIFTMNPKIEELLENGCLISNQTKSEFIESAIELRYLNLKKEKDVKNDFFEHNKRKISFNKD